MSKIKPEVAKRGIESFEKRFGKAHLYLAYHAAFPLSLTPDLLYRLWGNFQRDIHSQVLGIPWIAVADLLLSSLCDEVGHELYEMNVAVRNLLLSQLKEDEKFGQQRIDELSDFLLEYVQQQLLSEDPDIRDFAQTQRWIALAYTRTQPSEAVRELALALSGAYQNDRGDLIRLASLVETLAEPLGGLEEFQPLLIYARDMKKFAGRDHKLRKEFERVSLQTVQFEVVTVDERGIITNRRLNQANFFIEDLGNGITLDMVEIPSGTFVMGSPPSEKERSSDEDPQHTVTMQSFFMGMFAVTQEQYQAVMGYNPSYFEGPKRPVENVSWDQASEFCAKLSQIIGKSYRYRLPCEAEWEYACRARTTTPFHYGDTITTALANYNGNYTYGSAGSVPKSEDRQQTTNVGSFPPNAFWLYDMHGNVWEWCLDSWHDNYNGGPTNGNVGLIENDNQRKLLRGGSWTSFPGNCRSANRDWYPRVIMDVDVGFRVVVSALRSS